MRIDLAIRICAWLSVFCGVCSALAQQSPGWQYDRDVDRDALPSVPPGFAVSFFAREPLVRQPCSMAFDAKGRLCVGMGPQYRNPRPDTPGDSVVLVLDDDGDGRADRTKTFATGFNNIQGLAWRGRDLWVANAPDLTVVRDLDSDDEADEYVRVYTDLGNLEHGLHGLNWAPDGRLYMSKGNSKGLTQPGRVAPLPFRELWGVRAPAGAPDYPPSRTFKKGEYEKAYHDPEDDWGREGGVLRCDDGGANLEIVARGFRNPWDIAFDSGFNWLGTDNDQTSGDRVFMPFLGAHFGWNHPWSSHWGIERHTPSAPVSGPLFEGSGTGVVFGESPQFPPPYRGVFFINDWLRKTTFVWRPRWDGALLRPVDGAWEPFVRGGSALFRPTDLEVGPDGALWILGWGAGYGAEYKDGHMTSEGRVFRVVARDMPLVPQHSAKRTRPLAQWSVAELVEEFDGPLPVWRIDAQEELVRRGVAVKADLLGVLRARALSTARETWSVWALGRLATDDRAIDAWCAERVTDASASLNLRVQALRILAHRARRGGDGRPLPEAVRSALREAEPRLRFEAVQALRLAGERSAVPALFELCAVETDAVTQYAAWQTLRRLADKAVLRASLADPRGGVRQAALLALLEDHVLGEAEVRPLAADADTGVRVVADLWLRKAAAGGEGTVVRGRPLDVSGSGTAPAGTGVGVARKIQARSGAPYRLVAAGLRTGARPYADRAYDLRQIPAELLDLDFIQTANDDDGSRGEGWLSFEVLVPVRVHVGFDTRRAGVPSWVGERFRRSEHRIRADHWTFQLYSAEFPAGRVELGGNTDDGRAGGKGNYMVVLEPLRLVAPGAATGVEAALASIEHGDRDRGEWLFHARGGAGCSNCHRLGERGNAFGPDLGSLATRATVRHMVQSMLEPDAVITEGFNLLTVGTAEGEISGILLEESGLALTMGLATGERRVIAKAGLRTRRTERKSAMPAYDAVLTSAYAADLAAYLMTLKGETPGVLSAGEQPGAADWPPGEGFQFRERIDRLIVAHSGRPVGEFVFRDERILRPYWARVFAPNGILATRNHPPRAGVDAMDHDTMHPGIWLAFGDVSGEDFWRNKGRIEHVRFLVAPAVRDGRLVFATESRLVGANGRLVCSLTNRLTLEARADAWVMGWDATFHSDESDFTFGDQEEMGFAARMATGLEEKAGGQIRSSAGLQSAKATWGQSAEWCDYAGTSNGRRVGITLVPHPDNFRPSWWHNRDYGVFVANPFGRAAMRQGEKSAVTVRRGEVFRLRFSAIVHGGEQFDPRPLVRELTGRP